MLFDHDAMLQLSWNGEGWWHSLVPAHLGTWRLDPQIGEIGDAGKWSKTDPKEAKALMSAAGYSNGIDLRYIYTNNACGERFNQWAEAVVQMLKGASGRRSRSRTTTVSTSPARGRARRRSLASGSIDNRRRSC
ncbi:MAG: hypothetical protein ACRDJE_10145 [Dehalococcoidia bacterium]